MKALCCRKEEELIRLMPLGWFYLCVVTLHEQPSSNRDRVVITVRRNLGQCETPLHTWKGLSSELQVTLWGATVRTWSFPACISG